MQESTSLLGFLLTAFLAGFASIFMPCIFPIMPMTVTFFIKQKNGTRNAIIYGLSIMLIFASIGLLSVVIGSSFFNAFSTNIYVNLAFFIIFVFFGLWFLGVFEVVLPHSMVNKIDAMSERGGLLGIFFMALTLVVVSFSCTAPFVGSLLVLGANGEVWRPFWGMLVFGLPFALAFTSLAMFPQMLKSLPKSGGWMNEMKAAMGLLEFALALKFLSNVDLAYHWNFLNRDLFLVIWLVIFVLIGIYILGIVRLPRDEKVKKYNFARLFFGTLSLSVAAYLSFGLFTDNKLSLLSGLLPPKTLNSAADGSKLRPLPHDLQGFYDYDDALAYAKEVGKPLFIDFTGYACANCRKMEENVWPQPEVLEKLKNDFVIASLYVDDKKALPKEKQYVSKYDDELKETVGDKNMDIEIIKYNNNAQPYYVIEDSNGKPIVKQPIGYSSKEDFIKFLNEGIGNYK